ncbi:MAG: glutamate synthase large subunit [Candidatus Omnitrophica bacterium]|nr:glutamate synthase large subunit [Candidatus Omnitrophota bacterium]
MDNRRKLEQFGLYDARFEHDACGVGFVCDIKGNRSNQIIRQGLDVLRRLSHRGATGADPKTGDGAGVLIQTPHKFFTKAAKAAGIGLPEQGAYGTGLIFFPVEETERKYCKDVFSSAIAREGMQLLGWRSVPLDNTDIGHAAQKTQPVIEQVFIARGAKTADGLAFERELFFLRKQIENTVRKTSLKQKSFFYITNLSCRTFSYKGLLMPYQVENFFLDLKDRDMESALCLVHSRYSTNTFPTCDLAQPFRYLAHNGEINTLRGNINWMSSREGLLKSEVFKRGLKEIFPIIVPGGSDSASIDNVFELLVLSGRPLPHAMMMLIPGAWERNNLLGEGVRDFYKFHGCFMEPWDGPAAIAFTDGSKIGAVLDRNGLRPARYIITKNNFVVMASEAGVLDIQPQNILRSGRLEPGKIFFIDTEAGRIVEDDELKEQMAKAAPYGEWLKKNMVELDELPAYSVERRADRKNYTLNAIRYPLGDILTQLKAFGYTREDLKFIIKPMVENAQEPVGAMGNDTPHAVLSNRPQLLYNYFKQLFAQVTNPAIDPIREEIVMSLESYLGPEKNILEETPGHCHKLRVRHPVITNEELAKLRDIGINSFKTKVISILFGVKDENEFPETLERIYWEAEAAIKQGYTFIILSDRGVDRQHAALPALIAVSGLHHHLVKNALRTQISIVLESAEPREVHHFALLFGFGADAVNPYLAYEAVRYLIREKEINLLKEEDGLRNYVKAVEKGILKVLSKMGISTLQSYRGSQIFEALGLNKEVIESCFPGTVSRIGGAGLKELAQETILRHREAYPERGEMEPLLAAGGAYQWKRDGEFHLWYPDTIAALQDAAWNNDYAKFKEFARLINDQSQNPCTLRSLLKFSAAGGKTSAPIPINEVEPVEDIVTHFVTGAMSFGSISKEAHETIAIAMNRLKARSNTGEGGEDPARFHSLANGDSTRSAVKQIASGRFGVTTNYLVNADEIQIKIAQGAKPGEGGQLPGHKVSVEIARTRYTTPGVTLISPPPHHDIYSIEDLAQLIFDLKNTNPDADINVKLVSEMGVGTIAAGVVKGHADKILISGGDGGTGASPLSSIKHAGLPWELGLAETHQTLVLNDLRSRVRLQTDGQMRTGRDVAIAALLGAEEFGFATAILILLGCVMLRHCNLNNCSVGVATQDEVLRKRFRGRPEYIVNYLRFVAQELREIMAALGIRRLQEMVGRTEFLEVDRGILPWKARQIDFSRILYKPEAIEGVDTHCTRKQAHGLEDVLDLKLIALANNALENAQKIRVELPINNTNRTAGAMLSGKVCKIYGEEGLPEDTIYYKFNGIAGQSFGAWLAKGVTFELEGMANDYVGKGISGGKLIIYPDKKTSYKSEENIIIGNTAFYGAITGEAYIRGKAGERFCIRNSGLMSVVEGIGDHGCEYMTGGRVIVLGSTGRNFAAGMSGGIAYVYDLNNDFRNKCNTEMVALEKLSEEDVSTVKNLLANHYRYTQSTAAKKILDTFYNESKRFIKVMPLEYKRILQAREIEEELELAEDLEG